MSFDSPEHVCFVSYVFPPFHAGGSVRSKNFVKHLPRHGWIPHILTVRQSGHSPSEDEKLKKDLGLDPRVTIHRPPSFDPFAARRGVQQGFSEGRSHRIMRWLQALCFLPDRRVLWLPFAIHRGRKIMKQFHCQAIYSTSGPPSNHLVAFALKRLTGRPWIADFRDLWANGNANLIAPTFLHRRIHHWLERLVIRHADHVIGVGDHIVQELRRHAPNETKFSVITNGFDPEIIRDLPPPRPQKYFLIGYMGSFFKDRNPDRFLSAVEDLLKTGRLAPEEIRIRFVSNFKGPIPPSSPLSGVVELIGPCPHETAIAHLAEASVLLLIGENKLKKQIVNAKIFDYMAMGKPILALVSPDSAVIPYLERTGLAIISSDQDEKKIAKTLFNLYLRWKEGTLNVHPNTAYIAQFDVSQLARRLALVLDRETGKVAEPVSSSRDIPSSQL